MAETFVDISLFPDPPSPAHAAPPASEPKLATVAPILPPAAPAVLEEPLPAVESEGKKSAVTRMRAFKDHLEANYHAPDFDAVEIVMCALVSHFYVQSDPVWLFVEGRSRCGKTSCCINPMTCLPNTYMLGDISTKTFLSGWKDSGKGKGKSNSLLTQIGSSGILLFKDFTTIISKRAETRAEIVAQLRELHDGRMSKNTGMGGTLDWSGKITVIAATTPAVEQQWTMLRQLGERFLTVRYRSETSEDNSNSRKAMAQRGNEREIARKSLSLVAEAVDNKSLPSKIIHPTDEILNRLIHLARIVAMTRAQVVRVEGQIIDIPDYESPTGIAKSLAALVSARAALYRRDYLTDDDLKLATKVALDSIPLRRMQIIQWTPRNDFTSWGEIREHTRLAHSSLKWHLDEMIALNIIYKDSTSANDDCWGFTKEFRESWDLAIPDSVKLAIG